MWAQLASAAIGFWLMFAPWLLGYGAPLATSDRIAGPLVASVALVAAWEVLRSVRWLNVASAVWIAFSPLLLDDYRVVWHHVPLGVLLGALAAVPSRSKRSFGGGWLGLVRRAP
jgi:hypothetical protein